MKELSVINFEIRNKYIKHSASLSYCYQCATCSGSCPVALATQGKYNPRKIIEMTILGLIERIIEEQQSSIWLCSTCQKCVELCPQNVELTEIFTLIKNSSFQSGKAPESFFSQGKAILENGIAIPYTNATINRREKFGLPVIKSAPVGEIQKILKETDFKNKLQRGGS
ncbi:MAG: 4Fe-4S dicluster domain-containing protein [Promethearchaeota archaeon]|nr:MAG: 4Fe-4S dicluster domain-containing protein [Candidatus Lokiarchaeota archaeon]